MAKKRSKGPRTKSGRLSRAYKGPARDDGTPELQAKRRQLVGDADPALSVSVVGRLFAWGMIDQQQYLAAQRYRQLRCALYGPPWPGQGTAGAPPDDEIVIRMQRAFDQMVGYLRPDEKRVVGAVCVHDEPPAPHELEPLRGGLAAIAK